MLERHADALLHWARAENIGTLIRVPLAKGMLTGKYSGPQAVAMPPGDHRYERFQRPDTVGQQEPIHQPQECLQQSGSFAQLTRRHRRGRLWVLMKRRGTANINGGSLVERISIDPDILHGRPRVRHTRIAVSMVLELLAAGHTPQVICRELYPDLTVEDVHACIAFANQFLTGEEIHFSEELRRSPKP